MKNPRFTAIMVLCALILAGIYGLERYTLYRQTLPAGLYIAGMDVGGVRLDEAQSRLAEALSSPVVLHYADETITLNPKQVRLRWYSDRVWEEIYGIVAERSFREWLVERLLNEPPQQVDVSLDVYFDEERLRQFLTDVARRYDRELQEAEPVAETLTYRLGTPERWLDVEASLPLVKAALGSAVDREVDLVVHEGVEPPASDISLLQRMIAMRTETWSGAVGVFVRHAGRGEELALNADRPFSAARMWTLPVLITVYDEVDDPPAGELEEDLRQMVEGDVLAAGRVLAWLGGGDVEAGVEQVNAMLRRLGLQGTSVSAGTGEVEGETTPKEAGLLIEMIVQLARGRGALSAAFAETLSPTEGQAMLDLLARRAGKGWIVDGLPPGTELVHQYGATEDTWGDVGIVFSEEGEIVLSVFVYDERGLPAGARADLLADIATAVYNYFHLDHQYQPIGRP